MRRLLTVTFLLHGLLFSAQTVSSCVQTLNGEVRDKITNELLPNSIIILRDKDGNPIETQFTKEDARFSYEIHCDKEYKIEGKKEEYTAESKLFTTANEANKVLKIIILLGKGEIDFVTEVKNDKSSEIQIAKTDSIQEVKVDNSVQPTATIPEEKKIPKEIVKVTIDRPIPNIDSIYFKYDSSYLTKLAMNQLIRIVTLMKENPNIIIECHAYADAKGSEKYNQWISDRRAKRVIDYIISKGIDPSRISGKGYGESNLINDCTDEEVACTDLERAVNRRTEFIIVKR